MALVAIEGVTKEFGAGDNRVVALDRVDLTIEEGEFVVLVGRSGCGKTTLLRIIGGLIGPSEGQVRIRGARVTKASRDTAFMFQWPVLLPWRAVLGNVLLPTEIIAKRGPRERHETRARDLLRLVGLGGFEGHYPEQLSGGMQQRVALARALMTDPSLLLMDEPFAALDAITREEMGLELQRIWQEMRSTVVLVTHNITEALLLADRIVVMSPRPGRIRAVHDVSFSRPRTYAEMENPDFGKMANRIRAELL